MFTLDPAPGWREVTAGPDDDESPLTLARPGGEGAFHVTCVELSAPEAPDEGFLRERLFLLGEGKEPLADESVERTGARVTLSRPFLEGSTFWKIWLVAEGPCVVLASYNGPDGAEEADLPACQAMVEGLGIEGAGRGERA